MWDGWIILARVSQIREIFPDELENPDARFELEIDDIAPSMASHKQV